MSVGQASRLSLFSRSQRQPRRLSYSRINQSQEDCAVRGIDDDIRRVDIRGIRHRCPVGANALAQIVRLELQPPAEVTLRPGKLQQSLARLRNYVRWLV